MSHIRYRSVSSGQCPVRGLATYKNPRQNTVARPTFSRVGRFKLLMTGIGKRKMQISPMTFAAALAYQNAVRLMQVPGTFLFQTRSIGVHSSTVATMLATAYKSTYVMTP